VTTTGVAYCWGDNYTGALGDGTIWTTALTPVPVAGGLTFATVSAGVFHSCGVTTSGAAYCWGQGFPDSLGHASLVPVPVTGGLSFASVSAGISHTCGITTAGAAYCWGSSSYGELGDGGDTTSPMNNVPVPVAGGLTFAEVSAGGTHSCGVTTTGTAYCWGQNTMGELGDGTLTSSSVPVPVAGGLSFKTVNTAGVHSCGVTTTGAPYCWGDNLFDLLGSGTNPNGTPPQPTGPEQCNDSGGLYDWGPSVIPCSTVPAPVAGGLNLVSVTSGGQDTFACGLTSSGAAWCWGGERGLGAFPPTSAPIPVVGGFTFASLSAGLYTTCGVTPAGVAYCWGVGGHGELGTGTTSFSGVPVKVAGQP
jgi:alpha-tubulin suppressor-like RCC1 family protein